MQPSYYFPELSTSAFSVTFAALGRAVIVGLVTNVSPILPKWYQPFSSAIASTRRSDVPHVMSPLLGL